MKLVGQLLRVAHLVVAVGTVFVTLFGPRAWSPYLFLYWVVVVLVNLVAGGCPVTRIERAMTGENVTVVDPFLHLLALDVSKTNREVFTLAISGFMVLVSAARSW